MASDCEGQDLHAMMFWPTVLQDDNLGISVRSVLMLLTLIDKKQLQGASVLAMQNIESVTAIGPIMNPSAWLGGTRFDNARETKAVLTALLNLRDLLPDSIKEGS
jgi:hypothetical protein